MSVLMLSLFFAGVPSILIIVYFYRLDKRKPEPLGLIGRSVLFGLLAVAPAALIEYFFSGLLLPFSPVVAAAVNGFVIAGLVEESVKYFFVKKYIFFRKEFDEVLDGIVYTICVSLGFAFVENFLYGYSNLTVLLLRGCTSVPLHAAASGIMGYYIGLSKCEGRSVGLKGLGYATLVHGAYDFFLFLEGGFSFFALGVLAISVAVLMRLAKKAVRLDVQAGRS
jgi:protease PrsW